MKKHLLIGLAFIPLLCSMAEAQSEKLEAEPTKIIFGLSDGKISSPPPPVVLPEYEIRKTRIHHRKGRKIIVNRVVAPVVTPKLVKPPPTAEELERNAEEFARILAEQKPSGGFFTVGVTVYDHQTSHIQLSHDGKEYEFFSNVDWNEVGHFLRFEGRGKQFTMMVFAGNQSTESLKLEIRNGYRTAMPEIPKLPFLDQAGPSYMLTKGDGENDVVMEFLEAVHDLYADEKQVLAATYQERLKNNMIRKQRDEELRENPPPKRDIVINYWELKTVSEKQTSGKEGE